MQYKKSLFVFHCLVIGIEICSFFLSVSRSLVHVCTANLFAWKFYMRNVNCTPNPVWSDQNSGQICLSVISREIGSLSRESLKRWKWEWQRSRLQWWKYFLMVKTLLIDPRIQKTNINFINFTGDGRQVKFNFQMLKILSMYGLYMFL